MRPTRETISNQLSETDLRLNLALRAAKIGIWDWDVRTGVIDYSSRAKEIFGFAPDQIVTLDDVRATTHPDDLPQMSAMAQRALDPELREKPVFEYRLITADTGQLRWVLGHGEAIFATNAAGATVAVRYIGTVEDITESKALESALIETQMTQRLAIDAAHMAVWEFDAKTEHVTVSPELNRLYGFAPDEAPTIEMLRQYYLPGEQEKVREAAIAALGRGEKQFEVEFRIARRDGAERWMLLRAQVLFDAEGNYSRVIGVLMDIDQRKRGEQQRELMLRELNHRVKNSLSVVLAIAQQTFRETSSITVSLDAFRGRVQALAMANDVIVENDWSGFSMHSLVERVTAPYRHSEHDPFEISGPEVILRPASNVPLALALHELCTNAAKYGALSTAEGCVKLAWSVDGNTIAVEWLESGGPNAIESGTGFGTRMMRKVLAREFETFELDIAPTGARCRIVLRN